MGRVQIVFIRKLYVLGGNLYLFVSKQIVSGLPVNIVS